MLTIEETIKPARKSGQACCMVMWPLQGTLVAMGLTRVLKTKQLCHIVIGRIIMTVRVPVKRTWRIRPETGHFRKQGQHILQQGASHHGR